MEKILMKPSDFDEMFWFSDPESMGRVIYEKYNLNDFYNAELSSTLYQRVFCRRQSSNLPKIEIKKIEQLKPSIL
jgi:hypothetical protein